MALDELLGCDRLAQELKVLNDAKDIGSTPDAERDALRRRTVALFRGWADGRAALQAIVAHACAGLRKGPSARRGLRRDRSERFPRPDRGRDFGPGFIPTKLNFSYDFCFSTFDKSSEQRRYFPAEDRLGIRHHAAHGSVDLLKQKTAFYSSAWHVGPFQIFLIGGVVKCAKAQIRRRGLLCEQVTAIPRFDVVYQDFEIGPALKSAQQLQSYLSPKGRQWRLRPTAENGRRRRGRLWHQLGNDRRRSDVVLQRHAERVSGSCSSGQAESPCFKVFALGLKASSPFTMGVFPFVGSGYFAIFKQRATESGGFGGVAFEYGGGAGLGFGPLQAQCRIQAGVFVRIVDGENAQGVVNKDDRTLRHVLRGGAASIWIFSFATSCALCPARSGRRRGAMYGEAIYSFSFSVGIADFDYSVTVFRKENSVGKNRQTASLDAPVWSPVELATQDERSWAERFTSENIARAAAIAQETFAVAENLARQRATLHRHLAPIELGVLRIGERADYRRCRGSAEQLELLFPLLRPQSDQGARVMTDINVSVRPLLRILANGKRNAGAATHLKFTLVATPEYCENLMVAEGAVEFADWPAAVAAMIRGKRAPFEDGTPQVLIRVIEPEPIPPVAPGQGNRIPLRLTPSPESAYADVRGWERVSALWKRALQLDGVAGWRDLAKDIALSLDGSKRSSNLDETYEGKPNRDQKDQAIVYPAPDTTVAAMIRGVLPIRQSDLAIEEEGFRAARVLLKLMCGPAAVDDETIQVEGRLTTCSVP